MPGLEEAFDRIGVSAEHHLEASHAPGLALSVTDREDTLGVVVRGLADVAARTPVRPTTRFQIGSISKSFASLIVLQEEAAGRLPLDVSVNDLVPWLGLAEPFGTITLHHLMTHTAGLLVGTEDAPTGAGTLHRLRENPPTTAPGERFLYSNDGWKVVGACLEEVTGTRVPELLAERIVGPLGMTSTAGAITEAEHLTTAIGYEPVFTDRPVQLRHPLMPAKRIVSDTADGSIVSDVLDMGAYARLLLARGDVPDGRGGRLVPEDMFERWVAQYVDDDEGGTYGYGFWQDEVDGVRWIGHSGGMVGYTAYLAVSPDEGLGVVICQNGSGGKRGLARTAFAQVRAALTGDPLPDPWVPPAATDVPAAAEFAGTYRGDDGRVLMLSAEDGGLRLEVGGIGVALERDPLEEDPGDVFVIPHDALERFPLAFGRDDHGAVVEAVHGATWFRGDRHAGDDGDDPAPPPEADRVVGLYRNDDPWSPALRVLVRRGRLVVTWPYTGSDEGADAVLIPLEDGWFAAGSLRDPRRIRFLGEGAGGRAVVAEYNGGQWFRAAEA